MLAERIGARRRGVERRLRAPRPAESLLHREVAPALQRQGVRGVEDRLDPLEADARDPRGRRARAAACDLKVLIVYSARVVRKVKLFLKKSLCP